MAVGGEVPLQVKIEYVCWNTPLGPGTQRWSIGRQGSDREACRAYRRIPAAKSARTPFSPKSCQVEVLHGYSKVSGGSKGRPTQTSAATSAACISTLGSTLAARGTCWYVYFWTM